MSSGLEASIAGAETHMLGELSYALPASAQYMKKREELYWTSGAKRLRSEWNSYDASEYFRTRVFRYELLSFGM